MTHLYNESDLALLPLLPPSWRPRVCMPAELLSSPPTSPKRGDGTCGTRGRPTMTCGLNKRAETHRVASIQPPPPTANGAAMN